MKNSPQSCGFEGCFLSMKEKQEKILRFTCCLYYNKNIKHEKFRFEN